jgi:hypothetical protein
MGVNGEEEEMQSLVCERLQNEIFVGLLPDANHRTFLQRRLSAGSQSSTTRFNGHILERSRTELELRNVLVVIILLQWVIWRS